MNKPAVGDILEGVVVKVYPKFAILLFEGGFSGLLHISELSTNFIHNFTSFVEVGNIYQVKVIALDEEKGNMKVSRKQMSASDKKEATRHKKIDPSEIDFTALESRLAAWIEEANA